MYVHLAIYLMIVVLPYFCCENRQIVCVCQKLVSVKFQHVAPGNYIVRVSRNPVLPSFLQ